MLKKALIEWFEQQEDKDRTIKIHSSGKEYTANDLIKEIENQTEIGKDIEKRIIQLTIDLLFRKKENI